MNQGRLSIEFRQRRNCAAKTNRLCAELLRAREAVTVWLPKMDKPLGLEWLRKEYWAATPDILLEKMAKEIITALTDGKQPDQNLSGS
jgi:hypothetical protein